MFSWSYFFGAIAYTIVGLIFVRITDQYLKELEMKTAQVDDRFCEKLYWHVYWTHEWERMLLILALRVFWPITCIASILKAEHEYSRIKNHVRIRKAEP